MNDIMTTVTIPVGNIVICDACNTDFTKSNAVGGLICGSWAICPYCDQRAPWDGYRHKKTVRPDVPWQTFREFVIAHRGPDAAIKIISGETP